MRLRMLRAEEEEDVKNIIWIFWLKFEGAVTERPVACCSYN